MSARQQLSRPSAISRPILGVFIAASALITIAMFTFGQLCQSPDDKVHPPWHQSSYKNNFNLIQPDAKNSSFAAANNDNCGTLPHVSRILLVMESRHSRASSNRNIELMLLCLPTFPASGDIPKAMSSVGNIDPKRGESSAPILYQQQCLAPNGKCTYHAMRQDSWEDNKYGNLDTADQAFKTRPNDDWYLFIDAHTCVDHLTLIKLLKRLDPARPHYVGSPAILPFAPSQSGYLVSRSAMQVMFLEPFRALDSYQRRIAGLEVIMSSEALTRSSLTSETTSANPLC